jgi:hypothetical protein
MKVFEVLDLHAPDVVVGQHSIWLPTQQIKVPFQWGGRVQKYQKIAEPSYGLALLNEEYALLAFLAARRAAPPVGEWVYFQTVLSDHPGARWADPCGAYGYEMADATTLPPGTLKPGRVETQVRALTGALVSGSPGAWNDLNKPGNVINGYLVDVRRSGWDRLLWRGEYAPHHRRPVYVEDADRLAEDLKSDGQFPARARTLPYQEVALSGWIAGEREVRERARRLTFHPWFGETVLDIGTQLGGFLHYAVLRTEPPALPRYVGLDVDADYIRLARRLARYHGWNLCFWQDNLFENGALVRYHEYLQALWPDGVDHCLMLSMLKHLPHGEDDIWRVHSLLRPKRLYLETNAVKDEHITFPLRLGVEARGGQYVGDSLDRNRRRLYVVPRG